MALQLTLARPYAKAVFADAKQIHQIEIWSAVLNAFAKIIKNNHIAQLIINPQISREDIKKLLLNLIQTIQSKANPLKGKIDCFLKLLIHEKRLAILPDINFLYHQLLNNHYGLIEAEVICAFPLSIEHREQIKNKLKKRFNSTVKLRVIEDKSLLGGVIIRTGNWVIDGSVKGKLTRLLESLKR